MKTTGPLHSHDFNTRQNYLCLYKHGLISPQNTIFENTDSQCSLEAKYAVSYKKEHRDIPASDMTLQYGFFG
jgi:hypothetical protein